MAMNVSEVGRAEITSQMITVEHKSCLAVVQLDWELAVSSQLNYKRKILFVPAGQSTVVLTLLSLIYLNRCYFH